MSECVIHWFRKGLRLHDNPAFLHALKEHNGRRLELRPIFILDPNIARTLKVGHNRWRFLIQTLEDLSSKLKKLGSKLIILRGTPEDVFSAILKNWNVKLVTFESDIEPYSRKRDQKIEEICKDRRVPLFQCHGHTIVNPELVVKKNNGKAPLTYQKFLSVFDSLGAPPRPQEAPTSLEKSQQITTHGLSTTENYEVPTLQELGVDVNTLGECKYPGGETEALRRMQEYLKKTVIEGKKHSSPPVSLIGQLMWREFYYVVGADTPNFDKMVGNKICCQVPWTTNEAHLQAWTFGKTGYPFIDAIMRQLRQEGWIHHLARHAVACFLTRGDLWISWEEGQKVFEELLLDADWALNAGNWMWLSASAFFHQFFRVYSPVAFGKKTDNAGIYIKKYVPELKKIPSQYIYEPWMAPKAVQEMANCVVGKDYPSRIVIHEQVYKPNIAKMSAAYKANKTNLTSSPNKRKSETATTSKNKRKK